MVKLCPEPGGASHLLPSPVQCRVTKTEKESPVVNTIVIRLPSTDATLELGRCLGRAWLAQGESPAPLAMLLLYGDLGSGKTTLVRGLVEALPGGGDAEVSSPSFTLCNAYPTQPELVHCDLYRSGADLPEEAEAALDAGHWVAVEWAERLGDAPENGGCPAVYLDIRMQTCHGERLVTLTSHGEAAERVLAACREGWEGASLHATEKD